MLPAGTLPSEIPERPVLGSARWTAIASWSTTTEPVLATQRITTWAVEHDLALEQFSVRQPSLEDIYLELTRSQDAAAASGEASR